MFFSCILSFSGEVKKLQFSILEVISSSELGVVVVGPWW
jgi:hypothetical protein